MRIHLTPELSTDGKGYAASFLVTAHVTLPQLAPLPPAPLPLAVPTATETTVAMTDAVATLVSLAASCCAGRAPR